MTIRSNILIIVSRETGDRRQIPFTVSEGDIEISEKDVEQKFDDIDQAVVVAAVGKVMRGEIIDFEELRNSNWALYIDGEPKLIHHEDL